MNPPVSVSGWRRIFVPAFAGLLAVFVLGVRPCRSGEAGIDAAMEIPRGPVRCVVGVSPFLSTEARNDVYRSVVTALVRDVPTGSSLWVFDAYRLRTVTRFEVPDLRAFQSEKTRLNQFREGIRELRSFLAATNVPPGVPSETFGDAVRLPQFLDFVAENCRASDRSLAVVVLGSPLYVDDKEPAFSMVQGYFPSDGHLAAGRDRSVYGTKGREARLQGVTVHLGHFGEPWSSDLHRERVVRFWRLFVQAQSGRFGGVSSDLPSVFAEVMAGAERGAGSGDEPSGNPATTETQGPTSAKIEMLRGVREVGVADWITRDRVPNPGETPPVRTVGPLKVGIRWQGDVDLDLYVRPKPGAERLYFEHARSPEGYHYKDHRSSPDREYEFIEITEPVEVRDVEVLVNFHGSRSMQTMPPAGEVRLEFEGRIYSGRFVMESTEGNQGREGRSQARWWCRIDVPELLKLAR